MRPWQGRGAEGGYGLASVAVAQWFKALHTANPSSSPAGMVSPTSHW